MRKILAASALVLALGLTVLPATEASAWGWHHTQTQPAKMSTAEISLLTTVLDKVAITDIELSPFGRMIVNSVLRTLMPKLLAASTAVQPPWRRATRRARLYGLVRAF